MKNIDIWVILIFSALIFVCGLAFSKTGKNMKSYFAAGGALPWWMSGLSLFMSFFSAGTFVVWGSIAYKSGWVAVSIQWTMAIAGILIGFFIAPKWRKTNSLTVAEYITNRYGFKIQKTYTYLFLLTSLFTTGAFLYPVAKIVEVSTGIPIYTSIISLGILILIYTAVGGLWAVIVTDVLQFVVLTAVVIIIVPLAFDKIGGVGQFIELSPDAFFNLVNEEYSIAFIIAFGLYNLFFLAGNWAYVQRYTSVATPKDAQKVGWLFGALYVISPLFWMLPPMIYRILNPNLDGVESEGAYLLMCKEVLPAGMLGLMLVGMIFATSSSVNTTLNIAAGVFTNDLFKHFKPQASDAQLMRVGKTATVVLGLITIGVALVVPLLGGVVNFVLSLAAVTGGAMFLPPLWTIFSKKQTGTSMLSVTLITLLITGFFKFLAPQLLDITLSRSAEMILGVAVPMVLMLVSEFYLIQTNPSQDTYEAYVQKTAIGENVYEDDSDGSNKKGGRVIGIGVALTGALILSLEFISTILISIVVGVGAAVCLLGIFIVYKNKE
ncbi:Na+:solute symporter [Flavobacterium johnsoniae]|uniref:sodium:solute symporter family protein n=1 Tax=Flavobacterium TaxID=237 RepID=UPI00118385FE|nr:MULTISPECIES: sodium:solute symporter family protein [Flavobacterium]WET04054.1 Na+:solute symporter [Flavobacterium sp. YJ01]WJS94541.1 Na+:solute symporter [Flavobacterium johnsoniae]